MKKFIKEVGIYVLIPIAALVIGLYAVFNAAEKTIQNFKDVHSKKNDLTIRQEKLARLLNTNRKRQEQLQTTSDSGKVIYEVSGEQFSAQASFGIMFENILSNITNSGVRIRSIEYNYQPEDDPILLTNMAGYNACELSFVTVSNYLQLQILLKNIAKEKYLSSINEVYIEPYDNDKTILISKFKIRLYTKTI